MTELITGMIRDLKGRGCTILAVNTTRASPRSSPTGSR